ncbi:MAG: hypothetical protein A2Y53_02155 [Chloroflexi bacterium RBG_16_47_49]|nr:MAG: hypothetical protein A2Y53_02155 [Chloroflexi bacterium RBG_16_47_49]
MNKYAYFPGCSALKSATELDKSSRLVFESLGLDFFPLNDAACCGSRECGGLRVQDEFLSIVNNARTLAMAEKAGASCLLNVCSTCQLVLKEVNNELRQDPLLLNKVNAILSSIGMHYAGTVEVKHLLHIVLDDIGLDRMRQKVVRPLKGLNIAPFYGCHLLRPSKVHGNFDDPYKPCSLGQIIEALGATEVIYEGATGCCGFHSIITSKKPQLIMSGQHLLAAKKCYADLIVTPCPLCHTVLDSYQPSIENEIKRRIKLPIIHLSQMIGFAIGIDSSSLGFSHHMINPLEILQKTIGGKLY